METTQEYLMDSYFNDKDIYTLDEFGDIKEIRCQKKLNALVMISLDNRHLVICVIFLLK